jgi:hypothetical protein
MKDETIVKIVAIVSLVALEVVNLLTLRIDGNILLTIGAIIGGIAGYEVGVKRRRKA